MFKYVPIILMLLITGCSTYREPGYSNYTQSSQYAGPYSSYQRESDHDRNQTVAERQREYDRHQDRVQERVFRSNAEMRRNVVTGLAIIGAGYGVYAIERNHREMVTNRAQQAARAAALAAYND